MHEFSGSDCSHFDYKDNEFVLDGEHYFVLIYNSISGQPIIIVDEEINERIPIKREKIQNENDYTLRRQLSF